ncbi:hypothetical protein [Clostridium lundense]|uniref:hypothetical protein n=1 Tax=Clostridium lundense TaxID=319475 RepID=UPI000485C736|nr:hypothetical protein [Clostridium lundense]
MEEKYGEAEQVLIQAEKIKNNEELTKKLELLNLYKTQNEIYENANKLIEKKEYDKAIKELNKVDAKAEKIKKRASEKITFCKNEMIKSKIAVLEKYLSENKFNDAYKALNEINTIDSSNKQAVELKAKIDNSKINYGKEQKRIQEEKVKKPLAVEQARNLAIDVYFKKNPNLKEDANLKEHCVLGVMKNYYWRILKVCMDIIYNYLLI